MAWQTVHFARAQVHDAVSIRIDHEREFIIRIGFRKPLGLFGEKNFFLFNVLADAKWVVVAKAVEMQCLAMTLGNRQRE